jgi:hypothetical protein
MALNAGAMDPDAVSCMERVQTGSRIPSTECRANRAWAADAAVGRAYQARLSSFRAMQLPQ